MLPVYRLVQGLGQRRVRALLRAAIVAGAERCPNGCRPTCLEAQDWPSWNAAIEAVHRPATPADLEPDCAARRRLACDELVASQLALGLMRAARTRLPGRALAGDGTLDRADDDGPALRADPMPAAVHRRDRAGPRQPFAHAPPAAGRCRQRQDRGGGGGDAAGDRGRRPGGADGPDRGPGPSACGHAGADHGALGPRHRAADRPRAGQLAAGPPWPGSPRARP